MKQLVNFALIIVFAVLDPDLEIGGGGGEGWSPKKIFWSFGPQFRLKLRGEGGVPSAPTLDLPLLCIILVSKLRSVV